MLRLGLQSLRVCLSVHQKHTVLMLRLDLQSLKANLSASQKHAVLTLSLPCHLKTTNKRENLEPLSLFCLLFFTLAYERIFTRLCSIENICVVGPENMLFAGTSLHHSAQKFYGLGQ